MQLPPALKAAIDHMLAETPIAELKLAARRLSERYRAELRDGHLHMEQDMAVKAYLATRLPATYAAARASLEAVIDAQPDWSPQSLLDIGAGPGTLLWAATDAWPQLKQATLLEASTPARQTGQQLARHLDLESNWISGDVSRDFNRLPKADLVSCAYVLDELEPQTRSVLVDNLWAQTKHTLLIVEPGTPAGWQRILACRSQLIAAGAHIVAPCPHEAPCPLVPPDWCHFSRRVARSRLHRLTKDADVPWEDEKFSYLAVSRQQPQTRDRRILAPPKTSSGKVELKLCCPKSNATTTLFTRRDGAIFKQARRLNWGDALSE